MNDHSTAMAQLYPSRQGHYGTNQGGSRTTNLTIEQLIDKHLYSDPIGLYPMWPDGETWSCQWGCVDIDIKTPTHKRYDYETEREAHAAALTLRAVLAYHNITGHIERTRSRGRHIWVYAPSPVPARTMRRALIVACQIAQVPSREVNPKAETFPNADTLGNYVRLPYGRGHGEDGIQCVLGDNGEPLSLVEWLASTAPDADERSLTKLASLYRVEVRLPERRHRADGIVTADPYMTAAICGGPGDGVDRSAWLIGIGRKARARGHGADGVLEYLRIADEACGKYVGRQDRERRLGEIVDMVM